MGIDIARKCKLECKLPGNAAEKNDVREKNVDIQSNKKKQNNNDYRYKRCNRTDRISHPCHLYNGSCNNRIY